MEMNPDRQSPLEQLHAELTAELRGRVRLRDIPKPGKKIDPRELSQQELDRFGLPHRPKDGVQRALWDHAFGHPMAAVAADVSVPSFSPGLVSEIEPQAQHRGQWLGTASKQQRSLNWSGASISPASGLMFTQVAGSWRVPRVEPPANAPVNKEYRSSTWIGLDGQRRYFDSSLPQIGTSQFVTKTATGADAKYGCWWQWWVRDWIRLDVPIHLDVKENDEITCYLTVTNRQTVSFLIVNNSTPAWHQVLDVAAPKVPPPGQTQDRQLSISGATAEWVMERPRQILPLVFGTPLPGGGLGPGPGPGPLPGPGPIPGLGFLLPGELYDLPAYQAVEFSNCFAIAKLEPSATQSSMHDLTGARYLNLYERREGPPRSINVSLAQKRPPTKYGATQRNHSFATVYSPG